MKLLVVTDHRFYRTPDGVMDNYCFDRNFFDDYARVFEHVRVAARLRADPPPPQARRSDGDGIEFVELTDVQGRRWVLAPRKRYCGALDAAVAWADAVCLRIPSMSGFHAFRLARARDLPIMFELLGDPLRAAQGSEQRILARGFGVVIAAMTRWITRRATVGSYVSYRHLQRRYPARRGIACDSVSSIRLDPSDIRPPRSFRENREPGLALILVASLVPVKDHVTLLRAVAHAIGLGASLRLHLAGGGPLRPRLEALAGSLGIADQVVFHGHVSSRAALDELIDRADLFVMTSISEGMPRAMLEAMARGLPAIGTDAGGIGEILRPEQRVPIGDAHRLGRLLRDLSRDPARLRQFAVHSHDTVQDFRGEVLSQRRQRLLTALRRAVPEPSS